MTSPATLTGLAVGDALGMPFETQKYDSPALLDWDGSFQASAYHQLRPGQWTDDTMMSKCLAESLLEFPKFNPEDVAQRYLRWYLSGDLRGMGTTTKEAIQRLGKGTPWFNAASTKAEGNAPAMRAAPLGLFYRHDPRAVSSVSMIEASITHDSMAARDGAAAIALGVALLAQDICGAEDALGEVILRLQEGIIEETLSNTVLKIKHWRPRVELKDLPQVVAEEFDVGAHIVGTVASAYFVLALTSDYKSAVETAIRAGGDTDTRAAIVGALAGTFYGFEQVRPFMGGVEQAWDLRQLELKLHEKAPCPCPNRS